MEFGLSSEQRMLQDAVARYLAEQSPLRHVRDIATAAKPYSPDVAAGLADLGVPGVVIPAEFGGMGLGLLEAALIAEALGHGVAPVHFAAAHVMAPLAIMLGGSDAQRLAWLPKLASGEATAAVAISQSVERRDGAGVDARDGRLDGTALFVLDAADADLFVVADTTGALHLVVADAAGLTQIPLTTIDKTRSVGELRLTGVKADPLPGGGIETTRRIIDAGRIMLAADILGAGTAMIEQAVAYAGTRVQFGRPIGSFQAVKHMCAEMAAALEPCRSLVWYAAHAFDHAPDEASLMACHAKSHLSEVGRFVARTSTEVHGGMGFTDLAGLHFWFKRIGLDRQLLGGPELVRNEAARLQGWIAA
ncbi:MAG: acyl-CoA dehydrogenase family protein [Phenylobacterium sp.]|uniref:acyl-CoA dehydrogenase family protein n=1 Tax=Phenylobacterium sp. TaxID=1871053 RepID=UPI00271AC730|nr:acyl-CoA dehydrogenase family protein [Phenylobacterium sp.]MDO9433787.1 acyl-CoA dehydrogenase family protein [Phenylobacterium sp.]